MADAGVLLATQTAWAASAQSPTLRKFLAPMRTFGVEIPVLTPNTMRYPGVDYYRIAMRKFTDKLHPSLPPTALYGYGDPFSAFRHLGGAIVAQKGRPVRITWMNNLPSTHILPMDMTTIAPYGIPARLEANRAAPHLHGGLVPWPSDGGPYHWFSSTLGLRQPIVGPSVVNWLPVNGPLGNPLFGLKGKPRLNDDYYYPNIQTARLMWYHDLAAGISRLNAYAGLASCYILTDDADAILMNQLRIPADRQIPIVLQDKVFSPDGDLCYPTTYDRESFGLEPDYPTPPTPSSGPEFWGDTILANGTVSPFLRVEPRRYRFRILNACNTRFLSLSLVLAAGRFFPDSAEPTRTLGPEMRLIGTEGGFLDGSLPGVGKGVEYNVPNAPPLVLAPAERAELIVDFSTMTPGQFLILHNDAMVPFQGGTDLADFHPENRRLPDPPAPGFTPNTRTLLQFRVVPLGAITGDQKPDRPPAAKWSLPPAPMPAVPVNLTRELALHETVDAYGRFTKNLGPVLDPQGYTDPPTEVCQAGTVEIWKIFNLSADTHPIHFHYFNVRVLERQATEAVGSMRPVGKSYPPEPCELGWKETVRMNPAECITVLVEVPPTAGLAPAGVAIPPSPRLQSLGIPGAEYVWHCHILEREEHDRMRPLIIQEPGAPKSRP